MASPGSVVVQFLIDSTKAVRDAATFATGLGKVGDEAKKTDTDLGKLEGALDQVGSAADRAKGDLSGLDTGIDGLGAASDNAKSDLSGLDSELSQVNFDQVAVEAEETARRLRVAAGNMKSAIHDGADGVRTEAGSMRADLGEVGRESGAEFVGNIAEGIGSGQANLNDIVSGTLGGVTNLAASLTGPVGLAAGAAAAGIGLVFAAVKGQAERAKAQVDTLIGALEEVGDTSSKAAKAAIWDTWLEKMKENRGTMSGIVDNLKIAGVSQGTFRDAISGSAAAQKEVRDQVFRTGSEMIKNKQAGEDLTEEQEAYLENFPSILQELDSQNDSLEDAEDYFSDLDWLSDKTKGNVDKTGKSIDNAGKKADNLGTDLDNATKGKTADDTNSSIDKARGKAKGLEGDMDDATKDKDVDVRVNMIQRGAKAVWNWFWGGESRSGGGSSTPAAAGPALMAAPAPVAPVAPTVIVTEEQVYRAVSRLIMRGDARNGRMVVVG